jgi:hypothetical protein
MRGHVYIQREGDRETIEHYFNTFKEQSNTDLIDGYNQALQKGFFGVHGQALVTIARHQAFIKRFGKSPFKITDNVLIEFTQPILKVGNSWEYESLKN